MLFCHFFSDTSKITNLWGKILISVELKERFAPIL